MAKKKKKFWIEGAIKRPGTLRKKLGAKKGQPIPKGKVKSASKKKGLLGQEARLALTLAKLKKRKKRR